MLATSSSLPAAGLATAADTSSAPYAIEDFSYPNAAQILATKGIKLVRGDGQITLADCDNSKPQIRVMTVEDLTVNRQGTYCFTSSAPTGYLALELPRVFAIDAGDKPLNAKLTANGATQSVDIAKDGYASVGEGVVGGSRSTLVEIRVTGSGPAPLNTDAELPFVGRLDIGDSARSCSAVLIDPRWVVTAKSCFADKPAEGIDIPAGAPKSRTVVTIGTHRSEIVELAPRPDRDLVMARLIDPASSITPAPLSSTAAAAGEDLTVAGYGRTASQWRPTTPHKATFTVAAPTATDFGMAAKAPANATVCQGDAGSPAVRTENGKPALVGLVSRSWQNGCLDAAATDKTGASTTRVDDLAAWVQATSGHVLRAGQTIASGATLVAKHLKISMQADGNLVIYHNSAVPGKGGVLWASNTSGNPGAYAIMQADGNFVVYTKTGGDGKGGHLWSTATMNNPGAYLHFQNDGNLVVYKKDGGEGKGGGLWSSDTWMRPNQLPSDGRYPAGFWADSPNKILVMQRDGRLYIWDKNQGKELWSSNVAGGDGSFLHMGGDGNLVAYRKGGGPGIGNSYWSTATMNNPGAYLHFQNDGNLVVYKKDGGEGKGGALWSSNTWQ
ncbi:trypsin-like serine protease [Streptomyces sp. NPDC001373]|uniref:trypsin-like serine protease n=1 Tax=Streptomyces sp. NPDC001373 TaxID=3364565 RepID=UPI0036A1C8B3